MKPKNPIWNLETVVVAFKPPDEYPWQGRNSSLYYKIVLCNKYKQNIFFLFNTILSQHLIPSCHNI
jgi:hypothetical protein